ncbi:MAG TPA: metallophosphoesterase, partial [Cyclobacteriaceae bacterium]|nr:metallophosphoesterase [Cyclobacteriaceae bacterium]
STEVDSKPQIYQYIATGLCLILAILSLIYPVWSATNLESNLGTLLIWLGIVELVDSFRRSIKGSKDAAQVSAALSLLMGILLFNAELFRHAALHLFLLIVFVVDMVRYILRMVRHRSNKNIFWVDLVGAVANLIVAVLMIVYKDDTLTWVLSTAVLIRCVGVGITVYTSKHGLLKQVDEDVVASLGLSENAYVRQVAEAVKQDEEQSAKHDRNWIATFVLLLFVIHLGRMGLDRSVLGILSPLVATLGDIIIALIITYAIIAPIRRAMLNIYRKRAQRLWHWIEEKNKEGRKTLSLSKLATFWLTRRMRGEIRFKKAGYSIVTAIRTGLKIGLPLSALLAAVMPMLGMSWYFDTENWASGIWDKWAAARTDNWRMAMTSSVGEDYSARAFRLKPTGLTEDGDFSFVVVGDPGEGDASQMVLKDQILQVTNQPDVKFLVISSDVVYPTGALRDYEKKFWIPFKGVQKPVYAIPGNHDWYDALDGFVATFYQPEAAKKALIARTKADLKLTTTTEKSIDEMITQSKEWRNEYQVPTGFQNAPYFQVSTKDFVFISVETGISRQIDSLQLKWVRNVLDASHGKFVMVLLGHPFYAIGEYQGKLNPMFDELHSMLRKYNVPLAMAGDTHDLEYYLEPPTKKGEAAMHHFVNGGGGAYLSLGAALAAPGSMPTKEFAFYPSREPIVSKIEKHTAWYKMPAWWWTVRLGGWPFSAEWMSAMFDHNVSPFFQSFMEIRVERSLRRIVLIPYSNKGRIKWSDITSTAGARTPGATQNDFAEWIIPMP